MISLKFKKIVRLLARLHEVRVRQDSSCDEYSDLIEQLHEELEELSSKDFNKVMVLYPDLKGLFA
jgi:ubiquitin C-terminal hydrolase